jgi:hypothetical protein
MTFTELTSAIAESEGLKSQTSIGNVREITRLVLTTIANMPTHEAMTLPGKYAKKGEILRR